MQERTLHTVDEVARRCRVHPLTIRRHIAQGKLRAVRVGRRLRIREEDLDDYLDDQSKPADEDEYLKPFAPGDSLFNIIGIVSSEENSWLSSDKKRAYREPPSNED